MKPKKVFVGAVEKDKKGNVAKVLLPDGWVEVKTAPVKVWSKSSTVRKVTKETSND